jgi:galactofuranose transport system permease protein
VKLNSKYIPLAATALVMVVLYVAGCLAYPNFGSLRVFVNLFGDNSFLGIAAVGATFVILSGGIDLSAGSMVAFTGILIARLVTQGTDPLGAMAIALVCGGAFGAGMGALIHVFSLPPFLVTLGGMFFLRGVGFVVHPQALAIKHAFYNDTVASLVIPLGDRVVLPFTAICFVAVVVVATLFSIFTRFGRDIYAIGSNETSALLMGVPVGRTKIGLYALAGLLSAFAGCVATFYMQSGNPASFVGLELDAIAAAVIGGTLLTGGVGFVPGTMMGVIIYGLILSLITFQGNLNSWWTKIAVGALLLAFILLQRLLFRRGGR